MIINYTRPKNLEQAYRLIQDQSSKVIPLAGGSSAVRARNSEEPISVVDLQALGMDNIIHEDDNVRVGAMVRLNDLFSSDWIDPSIKKAVFLEANNNLRNSATLGGTLLSNNPACPIKTILLAMDAKLDWYPDGQSVSMGEVILASDKIYRKILTDVHIPTRVKLGFEFINRTPEDRVDLCVAVCVWSSGRTRIAVSGKSPQPLLAIDGSFETGAEESVKNAYSLYIIYHKNQEYIQNMIPFLVKRAMNDALEGASK